MKTLLPLSFLLFLTLCAFGQSKYQKGYYVTFQGDSIQRYIKNEDWNRNPEFIEVKSSTESPSSDRITMQQVKRFGFDNGDRYETHAVDVDTSPLDLNKMVTNAAPTIERNTVMLRALVKGPLNFYVYTDRTSKTHYYVSKGEEEPRELLYQKAKVDNGNGVIFVTRELYKGLLKVYFSDCDAAKSRIDKLEFKQSKLKELVLAYNACVNPSSVAFKAEKEKGQVKLGLTGGFTAFSYGFESSDSFKELVNADFSGQSATVGLAINYILPRAHGKWMILNEIMLKPYVAKGHYENSSETYETEFRHLYAGLNTLVRYSFTTGSVRPFINFGMANNILISDKSQQQSEKTRYGVVRQYNEKPLNDIRKYEQALLVGAGVSMGKYAAEARLERGNGFSVYTSLRSIKTAYTLQLTYFLR